MTCNSCTYVDPETHQTFPIWGSPAMVTVADAVCKVAFFGVFFVAILGACNVASTRTVTYTFLGGGATIAGLDMLTRCELDSNETITGIFVTILGSLGASNVLSAKGMSHWYLGSIAVGVLCVSYVATGAGFICCYLCRGHR